MARKGGKMTAGIFGAGVQARMQLWAVTVAREISRALVYDVSGEAADRFVAEMGEKLDIEIVKTGSPEGALAADIVCTATSSPAPVFDGSEVRPGTHINGIGSHTPKARELDTETVKRSRLIGDSREACFKEAGDIMIPLEEGAITEDHLRAELGEVVIGAKPGRETDEEITLFKSNGLAIQDAATAKLIYDKAIRSGVGTEAEI
jgi:alanine dehydrogenase